MEKSQQWSLAVKLCPGSSLELQLPRDHSWLSPGVSPHRVSPVTRLPAAPVRGANPGSHSITQSPPRGAAPGVTCWLPALSPEGHHAVPTPATPAICLSGLCWEEGGRGERVLKSKAVPTAQTFLGN